MRTDRLIDLLVQDSYRLWSFRLILALAVAGGISIAAIVFFAGIGFRHDISEAAKTIRFLYKFVVTIALAITSICAVLSAGSPSGNFASRKFVLMIAPALLVSAVLLELIVTPESQWMPRLIGHNSRFCLTLIPLLSLGPLGCILAALRYGAPFDPGAGGAIAGLVASGIAATFYGANCTDDSPLFVITWYPLATLIVVTVGYLIGRKILKW